MKSRDSKKNIEKTWVIIVILIVIVLLIFMVGGFYKKISNITIDKNMMLIEEQSNNIINILHNEIEDYAKILWRSEKFITKQGEIYSDDLSKALYEIRDNAGFDEIGILDSYGKMYTSEKKDKKFIYQEYFNDLEKDRENKYVYRKKEYISDIFVDKEDSKEKLMIIVPIKINDKCEYCIYGKCNLENIVDKILISKNSGRYFQIVDNEGRYVYTSENKNAPSKGDNIWDEIKKYKFGNGDSKNKVYTNIKNGKKGEFYFEYKNEGRYVSYKPIGINNWYIFSVQTEEDLNYYTREIWGEAIKLLFEIIIILFILIAIIFKYMSESKKTLIKKDEQLSIQNSIFNLVHNRINNIPFEVDLSKNILILYLKDRYNTSYIKEISLNDLKPCLLLESGRIKEEYYKNYESIYEKIINGKEIKSEIFKIKRYDKFHWIRVETIIINKSDNTKHIAGIFENYNEQMDKEEKIKKHIKELNIMDLKTKTDYLTSIFNREGFIQEVNYYLSLNRSKSTKDIFMILDLDNFKSVNDLLGHSMGDKVLIDTANIIKNNISKKDIVGRLAGDEFLVFIRDIESRKDLESIAQRLNKLLHRIVEKNDIKVEISASIGIASVEKNNEKFEDLYEKADKALYEVKYEQKNGYKIYEY